MRRMQQKDKVFRLILRRREEADLIEFLESIPRGDRTQAIRDGLRLYRMLHDKEALKEAREALAALQALRV